MGIIKKHYCEANEVMEVGEFGAAITACFEYKDGQLWVDNGEYANVVNYCPFCGYKSHNCSIISSSPMS